jgi:LysM repeat protein
MAAARRRRSPARWLAPVALATCAVAVYGVVHTTLKDTKSSSGGTSHQSTTAPAPAAGGKKTHHHSYRVKSGDTLSGISVKTGVSLSVIQRLNPKLDAQSLHAGQKIKLAP